MTAPDKLEPCPFCGGQMRFRKALWPSDGNVDAIIHAEPSKCGMESFSTYTTDESVIAAWNRRPTPSPEAGEVMRLTQRAEAAEVRAAELQSWNDEIKIGVEHLKARAEKMRASLQRIAQGEIKVFDEEIGGHVIVSMSAEEAADIANAALAADTDAGTAPSPAKPEGRE